MKAKVAQIFQSLIKKIKQNPKLTVSFTLVALATALIRNQQRKLIYFPQIPGLSKSPKHNPKPYDHPQSLGLTNTQNLQIETQDNIILRGWYIPNIRKSQRLFLYFHQNAGNIGARLVFINKLMKQTNSDVMIVGYRGYSDSQGTPSQTGIKKDSIAILSRAVQQSKKRNLPLIVLGKSLGGAVAIYSQNKLNNPHQVKGMVLQNTFTSISDIVMHISGARYTKYFLQLMLFFLLSNHWESYKLIGKLNPPILFIKSIKDQLIPTQQMDRLQKLYNKKATIYKIQNGTHNQTWQINQKSYFSTINLFLSNL